MKNLFAFLMLFVCAGNALALEPPPVLLIFHKNIGAETKGTGLIMLGISAWASHSVNKQSAVKVERFNTALGGVDMLGEASQALGCVGATEGCSGRAAFTEAAQFEAALAARPDKAGVVVEITPELIAEQLVLRAVSHSVLLSDKKSGKDDKKPNLEQRAGYVAVFTTRAPKELTDAKKSNPAALEQYWAQGEPRRIVSDTRRGFTELNSLFAMLAKDGRADGKLPDAWKALPKVKEFKADGRIGCSGPAWCASTFVLKDNGDSFVLVSSGTTAGWFDASAAAKQANLPAIAMLGAPGK